jgi:hypothetical protein
MKKGLTSLPLCVRVRPFDTIRERVVISEQARKDLKELDRGIALRVAGAAADGLPARSNIPI